MSKEVYVGKLVGQGVYALELMDQREFSGVQAGQEVYTGNLSCQEVP